MALEKVQATNVTPAPKKKKNPKLSQSMKRVWRERKARIARRAKKTNPGKARNKVVRKGSIIVRKVKTKPDLIVSGQLEKEVRAAVSKNFLIGQIKNGLKIIQDAAMTLNSNSADVPTNLELMGILLEQTIEIWRNVHEVEMVLIKSRQSK